jgi:hypothetical protein
MEVLEEICQLLNIISAKKFIRIAIVRVIILGIFFFLFLTTTCEVAPGRKLECTYLDFI